MDLSIIIVNWNTQTLLRDCLHSLCQDGSSQNWEIWVVDNASGDGSIEMVRAQFPQIHLIVNEENVGFARATNQALAQATGRFCLLLNPDTVVPTGALDRLLAFMEETPDAGIAGCRQVYPDGVWQATCHREITLARETIIAFGLSRVFRRMVDYSGRHEEGSTPRQVDWVEGGALLIRTHVLSSIGLLDESFFMYAEDADLCLRARQANFQVYYVPDIQIIHHRGQATGFEERRRRQKRVNTDMLLALHRSKAKYFYKHYGDLHSRIYQLLVRIYSLRKLSMGLVAYLSKRIEPDAWRNISRAYLLLLKASLLNMIISGFLLLIYQIFVPSP